MAKAFEVNFDGLVGPTHNYAGLSHGNVASTTHQALESNPLEAVLQGLEKMRTLAAEGFHQGVIPPQERPDVLGLRSLGFAGSDKRVIESAFKHDPRLFAAFVSASSMWTANAATVSPSADTRDRKVHFTPANLVSKLHRAIEAPTTAAILKKIFRDPERFVHHDPLPAAPAMGDEGAANHTRLCADYGARGVELFVYGRRGLGADAGPGPKKFPARQTLEASEAVARSHALDPGAVVWAQQNPDAIDAGVFHNDVAGVGNQNVYFFHGLAYSEPDAFKRELAEKFRAVCGGELHLLEVPARDVSLADAVKSYLFNSQLLTTAPGRMTLVAPIECRETPAVARYLDTLLADDSQPIRELRYFNLRQSMRNGGGPACLRLRVALTAKELSAVNPKTLVNEKLHGRLVTWAKRHYRDRLALADLGDPNLLGESRTALDELTQILGLGSIYPFQH